MVLVPHSTMKRLWRMSSGSMPEPTPIVAANPFAATAPQMARSSWLQPIDPKSRMSIEFCWIRPCTPAELYGRMASAPCCSTMRVQRAAMSARASSHETRVKRPSPFAPTRFSGCSTRSG